MTHEEAFIEEIAEHPEDDAPRLVYADWLEDHGDAAKAEFIRVACELARLGAWDPRRASLEDRWRQLLQANKARWVEPIAPFVKEVGNGAFHRGLLQNVSVLADVFVEQGALLFRHAPIREIRFHVDDANIDRLFRSPHVAKVREIEIATQTPLTPTRLAPLWNCLRLERLECLNYSDELGPEGARLLVNAPFARQLRFLWLLNSRFGANGAEILAEAPALSGLEVLMLADALLGDTGVQFLASSKYLSRLSTLMLSGNEIGPAGARALSHATCLPSLENLDLSINPLGNAGVEALCQSSRWGQLKWLDLTDTGLTSQAGVSLAGSCLLESLTCLDLRMEPSYVRKRFGNRLGAAGAAALGLARAKSTLESLDLSGNEIADDGAKGLARWSGLATLRKLNLNANDLTAFGLKELTKTLDAGRLRILELRFNRLGDLGAKVLANWPGLANLHHLDLAENRISDEGALALVNSPHLTKLDHLSLAGNDISESCRASLSAMDKIRQIELTTDNLLS